jgi:hypothetical protein
MIRHRLLAAFGVGCLFFAASCGGESDPSEVAAEVWSVDSAPWVSIGLSDAENLDAAFARITGATRLPDGRILVADVGETPLKLFDLAGVLVRRVARKGQGPQEIEFPARLFRCGDLVYTYDIEGRRVLQWSLQGEFQRELRFPMPASQGAPYASACNLTGRFVHLGWGQLGIPVAGYHRDTVPAWTTAAADSVPVVFDSIPSSERWGQTHEGRIVGSMPLPFGKQPHVGVGADFIAVATGDPEGVRLYGLDGRRRGRIILTDSAPPVTPEDVRLLIEREVIELGETYRRGVEREYSGVEFPKTKSNVSALVVDSEGLIWIRPPAAAGAGSVTWQVFDPSGAPRATLSLPEPLEVFEIGVDYILGRELDASAGVPLLRQYRLRRAALR